MSAPDIDDPIPAGDIRSPIQQVEDGSSNRGAGLGRRGDDDASLSFND